MSLPVRQTIALIVLLLAAFAVFSMAKAHARDLGQWQNVDDGTRDWYKNAQLTETAKKRLPYNYCCDHADVVRTQFKVNRLNGDDVWEYELPDGAWKVIPSDIIHMGETAPGGKPTLFVYNGTETCFWPGQGGI